MGGKCKVAWPVVCSPRNLGGLGLPDLRVQGFALRLRWEWQRRVSPDAPWAHLPATPERLVFAMFDASTSFTVGNGETARFWTDLWLPVGRLYLIAPLVFGAVPKRWRRHTVREALLDNQWAWDAAAASTTTFMAQFLRLWSILEEIQLDPDTPDRVTWRWTTDG